MSIKNDRCHQPIIFALGMIFFLIAAALGWEKLQYGFNFLDEGYHMTESWRLAAGDYLLKDRLVSALRLYVVINRFIFEIFPDITLLGFRKLQYFLTMCSLLIFSFALFKVDRQYWYQPFVFSLFAFTGLDPIGMFANLNYYTYPHSFLVLYLSFLLLGLYQQNKIAKRIMYIVSGIFLWGISFSLIHLSVIILSPILLFLVSNKLKLKSFSFKLADVYNILIPFFLCWTVFLIIYNKSFLTCLIRSVTIFLTIPGGYTPDALMGIDWEALKHIGVSMMFLVIVNFFMKNRRLSVLVGCLAATAIMMFLIIDTSLFGLIAPYYNGWFSRPMWFSSLFVSFFIMFLFAVVRKHHINRQYSRGDELAIILFIPCAMSSISNSFLSTNGILSVLLCSIPATAAIANLILYRENICKKACSIKLLILLLFLTPFYYTTAWSDWKFTFFDTSPEYANVRIDKGFGKGIMTNRVYHDLYEWIRTNAEKDDFMISYIASPMVYMISKLRPALDFSRIEMPHILPDIYEQAVENMKKAGRNPKIAFVFQSRAAFYPVSLKENRYKWFSKVFNFSAKDPLSRYIIENMKLVDEYKIFEGNTVRCFVDQKALKRNLAK
jgi:hypothetical protein